MTKNRSWIIEYRPLNQPITIELGDGTLIQAKGFGGVVTTSCKITEVHYVPDIGHNLISVTCAMMQGFTLGGDINTGIISYKNGKKLVRTKLIGRTQVFDL